MLFMYFWLKWMRLLPIVFGMLCILSDLVCISVDILSVNGFIEWHANISGSIRGLFCIVFLLLLVSFCVWWKSVCGRGALIWLAGVSGRGLRLPLVLPTEINCSQVKTGGLRIRLRSFTPQLKWKRKRINDFSQLQQLHKSQTPLLALLRGKITEKEREREKEKNIIRDIVL